MTSRMAKCKVQVPGRAVNSGEMIAKSTTNEVTLQRSTEKLALVVRWESVSAALNSQSR